MSDKKSWKHALKDFFKTTKSTVAPAWNSLDSNPITTSKICDAQSPSISEKPNFEGITLIWYDPRMGTTDDTKITTEELREINDRVIMCSDPFDCLNHIQSVENEKIFLITSGKGATSIVPEIHQLKQVDSIFIFCLKIDKYQHLLKEYESIVGIYKDRSTLFKIIGEHVRLLRRQLDVFSFYDEHKEKATRDLSKESAEFLWFQLLKDILLQMPRNDQAKQELIDFSLQYYRGNRKEHKHIIEFQQSYKSEQSIPWYTKDSFLYRLVNKALRTEDVEQLQIFRFFISDLSSKLAEIYSKLKGKQKNIVMLYRGFQIETDEFNRLKQNLGCIIAANGFLSVSRSKKVAIEFATRSTKRTHVVPVLYEIECDLATSKTIIFADIAKYSEYPHEEEVLFDLGSTFQINSISKDEELKMTTVKLTATDAGMKMADKYIELNRKMNEETTPDILFGILLIEMGKYDQSLSYFSNLLSTSNGQVDVARIHSAMGSAYLCKDKLEEAYQYADRAYQMMIRTKPPRVKDSSRPMSIMGHICLRKEKCEDALDFYFEALEIRKKFYGEQHLDTAVAFNHIGNAYYKMVDYLKALEFYKKSLKIREQQLPHVHLDIAASLNNIGLIYWKGEDRLDLEEIDFDSDALTCFQESLSIRKQVLPPDHKDIIQSLENIACFLYERGDIDESLKYFTEAFIVQKIEFDPSDHDNLLNLLEEQYGFAPGMKPKRLCFRLVYAETYALHELEYEPHRRGTDMEEIERQEEEKRIELKKEEDIPILENFIKTLDSDDDYDTALAALTEILQTPQNFRYCSWYDHNKYLMKQFYDLVIGAYDRSDESNKTLRFYEKVQFLLENRISHWANTNHIQKICLKRIGRVHQVNENYEVAVELLERSVNIEPSAYIGTDDGDTFTDIGLIHMILGHYNLALTSFEKALEVLQENDYGKDRQIRLISKRIKQAKEAVESVTDS